MIELLKQAPGAKTVTLANGGQFAMPALVSKAINSDIYFAKPYASYQRGTNKNTNGIIHRQWPIKMALGQVTEKEIEVIEFQLDSMPRKVLGGLTPLEVYTVIFQDWSPQTIGILLLSTFQEQHSPLAVCFRCQGCPLLQDWRWRL
ncbi:transposase [Endozoicomonas sp.]|uniref:transposase n=1 Tax=Endozoicomonas sp. TaxID=1892382 RepID=UPI00383BA8B2